MKTQNLRYWTLIVIGITGVISLVLMILGAVSNSPYTPLAPLPLIVALGVGVVNLALTSTTQQGGKSKRSVGKYADIDDFVDDLTIDELAYLRHRLSETDGIEVDKPPIDDVLIDDSEDVHAAQLH